MCAQSCVKSHFEHVLDRVGLDRWLSELDYIKWTRLWVRLLT